MSNITYSQNGDYLIPNLTLVQTEKKPLGKYGRMRKEDGRIPAAGQALPMQRANFLSRKTK